MPLTEHQRHHAYEALQSTFGERTDAVIDYLRPDHDLATGDDLAVLSGTLRAEMADLRGELRGEMADLRGELRGEMADLRGELRGEMANLRGELRTEMAELRTDLTAEIHRAFTSQTRALMFALVTGIVLLVASNLVG